MKYLIKLPLAILFLFMCNYSFAQTEISSLQYFYDSDPGVGVMGNGNIIDFNPAVASIDQSYDWILPDNLTTGIHYLYTRVKGVNGSWSLTERQSFYILPASANTEITGLEYFFNTDPGVGNGISAPVSTSDNINADVVITLPTNLTPGIHYLYSRVQGLDGSWSLVDRQSFYVIPARPNTEIAGLEYFFNSDPGVGNGISVPVSTSDNINENMVITLPSNLSPGIHYLYSRVKGVDGSWSLVDRQSFYVIPARVNTEITALEYFFDADPGVGNANPIDVETSSSVDVTYPITIPCLSTGDHYLYVRARGVDGTWSLIDTGILPVTNGVAPAEVVPTGPISECAGSIVTLSYAPVDGVGYQWVKDGTDILEFGPTLDVTQAGEYSVKSICNGVFIISNSVVVSFNGSSITYYEDADSDGFGNPAVTIDECTQPVGYVDNDLDCDDTDEMIYIGAICDDGDPNTSNDLINANCICEGDVVYDCPSLLANIGDACDDGDPNTSNDLINANCICEGDVVYDCPSLLANIGDACDDGDANTANDLINANCICEGDVVYDCPSLLANIGDACDDGDPNTSNDLINANCICEGDVVYDCPILLANIGDACDDGDPNTSNDLINANCICEGDVVYDCPSLLANIGDACDDGDPNTANDLINANCICEGDVVYDCPSLLANIGDACDDGDPNTSNDLINVNCICEGNVVYDCPILMANIGDACDDGDANTSNDLINANCICEGDVVYDCPILMANIGDACDDGDANTSNDLINANCICEGDVVYDCPSLLANIGDACDDGDPNTAIDLINANCICEGDVVYDCPILMANIGDACDDGDPNTSNDLINANCICEGDVVYDCPSLLANIGDACDDGDANTANDLINANCICEGDVVFDCPSLLANIGDACDDGDANTSNDLINANCICEGDVVYDCPILLANIGDSCDDGDPNTANDLINANCICEGDVVYDCPSLLANIGDACDDGDPNTSNDLINANCICEGDVVYDCPSLLANIGDACDDGDPNTANDLINANCICEGDVVYDCPSLLANIGDACDDGDPNTTNDLINANCICEGVNALFGCTEVTACNYDPLAIFDDGSCDFGNANCIDPCIPTPGCTDNLACNYNPLACIDDGTCDFGNIICIDPCNPNLGCTDITACNYNPIACEDNGTCEFNFGCTSFFACNYNPLACIDDGTCDFGNIICIDPCNPNLGCTDITACNYNPIACEDNGTCEFNFGCTDNLACNYNPLACIDDGTCDFGNIICIDPCNPNLGCTDNTACNYNPIACVDNGTCEFNFGCTDNLACNYNPFACIDDGTCDYGMLICINPCFPNLGCTDNTACNYSFLACVDDGSCYAIGDACDDGDPNTFNDTVDANCDCVGTMDCLPPSNDFAVDAELNTPGRIWGVPGWDSFNVACATKSSLTSCFNLTGSADTWYKFVCESENQGILVQMNPNDANYAVADLAVELYDNTFQLLHDVTDGECQVERSCFNNYGPGEIERCVPTKLTIGETYYYRVYEVSDLPINNIDTKVKTYVSHPIIAGCIPEVIGTSHTWTIEDRFNLYNIPPVPVFYTRLVLLDLIGNVVSTTPEKSTTSVDPYVYSMNDFGAIPDGDYKVVAQNKVKMMANGCVSQFWSQYGPGCQFNYQTETQANSGLENLEINDNSFDFDIYPNPSTIDNVTLSTYNISDENMMVNIEVYDNLSKKIYSERYSLKSNPRTKTLYFNKDLTAGIYFIQLSVGEVRKVKKLILYK